MRCGAGSLPSVCKSSLINTFNTPTFPNLVVFLTCTIMWCTGCFLLPPWFSAAPFFPTHWQPLDLESTAVIVIYALSHDRCARIVLSIRPRRLKVTARLGFNHCIFSQKKKKTEKLSTHIPADSAGSRGALTSGCRRQNPEFTFICALEKGVPCQRNIKLECNHLLEAILSQGVEHTSLARIFWVYWLKM